jgi:two-component system nitrate/nitrite response regulator NarL
VSKPLLTPRERQVVAAVAAGFSNRRIAKKLGIREQTVKNQLSVILQKLHVRTRLELAVLAMRERFDHGDG